jgi:hypothetical protein
LRQVTFRVKQSPTEAIRKSALQRRLRGHSGSGYKAAMRRALRLHPNGRRDAVSRIAVEVSRPTPASLALHYTLSGRMADIVLPPPDEPLRTDALWQHTCFELFVSAGGEGYDEFNFSPSTEWAAYRFDGYRRNRRPIEAAPQIAVECGDERLELAVALALPQLATRLRLGLSAVIEEKGGRLSYWALNHPPGNADFHHPDCFALEFA